MLININFNKYYILEYLILSISCNLHVFVIRRRNSNLIYSETCAIVLVMVFCADARCLMLPGTFTASYEADCIVNHTVSYQQILSRVFLYKRAFTLLRKVIFEFICEHNGYKTAQQSFFPCNRTQDATPCVLPSPIISIMARDNNETATMLAMHSDH